MRGYAGPGVQHIMFQCETYTAEERQPLTEALQIYRGMERQISPDKTYSWSRIWIAENKPAHLTNPLSYFLEIPRSPV
jgi:hypothetical protein